MKNNEMIKQIRAIAKSAGLTFKQDKMVRLHGVYLWKFTSRLTGETVVENCTLPNAYENCMDGYIESYNESTGEFNGMDL